MIWYKNFLTVGNGKESWLVLFFISHLSTRDSSLNIELLITFSILFFSYPTLIFLLSICYGLSRLSWWRIVLFQCLISDLVKLCVCALNSTYKSLTCTTQTYALYTCMQSHMHTICSYRLNRLIQDILST